MLAAIDVTDLVAILGGIGSLGWLGTALARRWTIKAENRKSDADTLHVGVAALTKVIEALEVRAKSREQDLDDCYEDRRELERRLGELRVRLRDVPDDLPDEQAL